MSEITSEYAKALFMLASEKECTQGYKEALETVEEVFTENPMYVDFLYTFAIPLEERLEALEKASDYIEPKISCYAEDILLPFGKEPTVEEIDAKREAMGNPDEPG